MKDLSLETTDDLLAELRRRGSAVFCLLLDDVKSAEYSRTAPKVFAADCTVVVQGESKTLSRLLTRVATSAQILAARSGLVMSINFSPFECKEGEPT